jgi:glycine cleavage system H protein
MAIKENLLYSREHEWVKKLNGRARIGISDYAQSKLGDVVYVEIPEVNRELKKGEVLTTVESIKTASEVYSPIDCRVVEVNSKLEDQPELLNQSPYDEGWIAVVKIKNEGQMKELLTPEDYEKLIRESD